MNTEEADNIDHGQDEETRLAMLSSTDSAGPQSTQPRRYIVIGGGISGLAAAYQLHQETKHLVAPPEILLLEGGSRLGGCINTYKLDDMMLELGPDSFITEKPAAIELCRSLGIEDQLIETDSRYRRTFVAHSNQLYPLPAGFMMMAPTETLPMLSSPLFSWQAKLRMLREPFVKAASADSDESLEQFVERRFGREVFDRVVQPLVGGIYTADPTKLSLKAALPRMHMLEQKYGSIVKGLTATRKRAAGESGARYGMFVTFKNGLGTLVDALVSQLPSGAVNTHAMVSKVHHAANGKGFQIRLHNDTTISADGVVIATASHHAAHILSEIDPSLAANLAKIEYASSAVLSLIYRRSDIPHPLDGFGFVVPVTERRTIMACSFSSVKWPGRMAEDKALLRTFIGGALQPDVYDLTDEQIECLVWEDLRNYLGIRSVPSVSVISRYPRAMPQYNVGHCSLINQIETTLSKMPGIALAGNAYNGVGIPDCILSGQKAAKAVLSQSQQPITA